MSREPDHMVAAGLHRYARALDHRDWPVLAELFAEQAVARYGDDAALHGRRAILAGVRSYLDGCGPSQHMIGNIDVDVGPYAVDSRCYVRAVHRARDGDAVLWSFGEYHARWIADGDDLKVDRWEMRVSFNHGDARAFGLGERGPRC